MRNTHPESSRSMNCNEAWTQGVQCTSNCNVIYFSGFSQNVTDTVAAHVIRESFFMMRCLQSFIWLLTAIMILVLSGSVQCGVDVSLSTAEYYRLTGQQDLNSAQV